MSSPSVSIIIPFYNEAESLGQLQAELAAALSSLDHELLFIDDGSTDLGADRISNAPHVRVLRFAANSGQSAAIYVGLQEARGAILVLIDSDLQNDPADIPRLVEAVENGADLACGYRLHRKDTLFKRWQSQVANAVRSRFTKDGIRDTGCTLKAMRAECREALFPFYGMHRFIPALIKGLGYSVVEIAVNHRARRHGTSKYNFGNRAWRATVDMFGVRWILSRQLRIRLQK